jgi:hypothetical protein
LFESGCFAITISQSHHAAGSQINSVPEITLGKVRSGDYRVNFRETGTHHQAGANGSDPRRKGRENCVLQFRDAAFPTGMKADQVRDPDKNELPV